MTLQPSQYWMEVSSRSLSHCVDVNYVNCLPAQVKLSNFREAVIPPPMCGYSLHLPSAVSSVAFAPPAVSDENSSNDVCVITGDNSLAVFKQNSGTVLLYIIKFGDIDIHKKVQVLI